MGNELAVHQLGTLQTFLDKHKDQLAVVLPKHMTADRVVRIVLAAASRTPKLLECTPESIYLACHTASQLGLEPGGPLGHAYLVPFFNGKTRRMECQYIPGYRGLVDLARRSGTVTSIAARVVYANDKFECHEDETGVHFRYEPNLGERGEITRVFAYAILKDGGCQFEQMTLGELDAIKSRSKSRDRDGNLAGPWVTDTEEMYRKTALKRLCKMLPASIELADAIAQDDTYTGHTQDITAAIVQDGEATPEEPAQQTRTAQVKALLTEKLKQATPAVAAPVVQATPAVVEQPKPPAPAPAPAEQGPAESDLEAAPEPEEAERPLAPEPEPTPTPEPTPPAKRGRKPKAKPEAAPAATPAPAPAPAAAAPAAPVAKAAPPAATETRVVEGVIHGSSQNPGGMQGTYLTHLIGGEKFIVDSYTIATALQAKKNKKAKFTLEKRGDAWWYKNHEMLEGDGAVAAPAAKPAPAQPAAVKTAPAPTPTAPVAEKSAPATAEKPEPGDETEEDIFVPVSVRKIPITDGMLYRIIDGNNTAYTTRDLAAAQMGKAAKEKGARLGVSYYKNEAGDYIITTIRDVPDAPAAQEPVAPESQL